MTAMSLENLPAAGAEGNASVTCAFPLLPHQAGPCLRPTERLPATCPAVTASGHASPADLACGVSGGGSKVSWKEGLPALARTERGGLRVGDSTSQPWC